MALSDKTLSIQNDLSAVPRLTLASIAGKHGVSSAYVHKVKQALPFRPATLTDTNLAATLAKENVKFIEGYAKVKNVSFAAAVDQMITEVRCGVAE
jgi:hypothetical protein